METAAATKEEQPEAALVEDDGFETRLAELEKLPNRLDTQIIPRIETLEKEDNERLKNLEDIDAATRLATLEALPTRIETLENADAAGRLDTLEKINIATRLEALENPTVVAAATRSNDLSEPVNALKTKIGETIQPKIEKLDERVNTLEAIPTKVTTLDEVIHAETTGLKPRFERLKTDVEARIGDLETELHMNEDKKRLTHVEERLGALEETLKTMQVSLRGLRKDNRDQTEKYQSMTETSTDMIERLEQKVASVSKIRSIVGLSSLHRTRSSFVHEEAILFHTGLQHYQFYDHYRLMYLRIYKKPGFGVRIQVRRGNAEPIVIATAPAQDTHFPLTLPEGLQHVYPDTMIEAIVEYPARERRQILVSPHGGLSFFMEMHLQSAVSYLHAGSAASAVEDAEDASGQAGQDASGQDASGQDASGQLDNTIQEDL